MSGLEEVIKKLEAQKSAIEIALRALREGEVSDVQGLASAMPTDKRSAGQKARWAAKRGDEATPAKTTARKGVTPEGRKALAEAMKRRWALKRAAAQAKKRPGRPKKAA